MTDVHTTCPYCGVGCGVVARADGSIAGDAAHPANRGRLCAKGAALAATLDDSQRLTRPLIGGQPARWGQALDVIAARFRETIAEHGPDSVAFYVSGQFLTEDYYVANKLMKGFIGSANIDTNSRLCMASSVAGHVRAFGEDVVPGSYDDFDDADLIVLVGSNTAWCHPVLYQRLHAARAAHGTRVVVLDPRRTATAEAADLHLPLAPGSDVALFNGLLRYLAESNAIDRAWIARHASGFDAALEAAGAGLPDLDAVAAECGIDPELLETFYTWWARTERVVTAFSQGVNQAADGTDKVNAIINCHLATGRIGRPGMGPFSLTGQPNAMGGREVGGLATQLAAHMSFASPADRAALRRFWQAPNLAAAPGLTAIEMFEAALDGRVKAIWIAGTNPAASLPRLARVRAALAACPFVVAADCWHTDTTDFADVLLPAAGWGEKDGTVTNSERRISRQRAFRPPPGEARPDWWMFSQLAIRMGFAEAFAWQQPAEIFREHAALSGFANDGSRMFDISALAEIDDAAYDRMPPTRWPLPARGAGEAGRMFAQGRFPTADGRARLVPTVFRGRPDRGTAPLLLNTGRVRDQWHTMTRTGHVPALMSHTPEPRLEIHPSDAAARGIAADSLVRVSSEDGAVLLRADLRHAQRRGEIFAPMHWTNRFAASGPLGQVVSAQLDPVSAQPALKASPVHVQPVETFFHGLLLHRSASDPAPSLQQMPAARSGEASVVPPRHADEGRHPRLSARPAMTLLTNTESAIGLHGLCHWTRIAVEQGVMFRLSGLAPLPSGAALTGFAAALLSAPADAEWLQALDARRGVLRVGILRKGALHAALFIARDPAALPAEAAMLPLLGAPVPDAMRAQLLAGRAPDQRSHDGPRICACHGVARNAVRHAVVTHRLRSVAEIGIVLGAGTNCGSCIPELEEILRDVQIRAA